MKKLLFTIIFILIYNTSNANILMYMPVINAAVHNNINEERVIIINDDEQPVCGNGICESDENIDNCEIDCDVPPGPPKFP